MTEQEANDFLSKQLGIDAARLPDRLELLNTVVRAFHNIPFHNMSLLSADPADRRPPTWEEVSAVMHRREGGLCYTMNVFAKHLLQAIGFDVTFLAGTVTHTNNHIVLMVRGVRTEDDLFLVDVGCGFPTFEAVPLDSEQGQDLIVDYRQSFLEFRYARRADEALVVREHRQGDPTRPLVPDALGRTPECIGGWRRFYDVFVDERGQRELERGMLDVCTVPGASPFLMSFRAVRWVSGRMVGIKDTTLLTENDEGELVRKELSGVDGMRLAIARHFPEIPKATVDGALAYWGAMRKQA